MNYATYYRYDSFSAWRFTSLRSGQPAASDRSPTGGKPEHVANTANCRTPQWGRASGKHPPPAQEDRI